MNIYKLIGLYMYSFPLIFPTKADDIGIKVATTADTSGIYLINVNNK